MKDRKPAKVWALELLPWILFFIMAINALLSTISGTKAQKESDKWFAGNMKCLDEFTEYVKTGKHK